MDKEKKNWMMMAWTAIDNKPHVLLLFAMLVLGSGNRPAPGRAALQPALLSDGAQATRGSSPGDRVDALRRVSRSLHPLCGVVGVTEVKRITNRGRFDVGK